MKLVRGIGINDAGYKVKIQEIVGYKENGKPIQKLIWTCPFYLTWVNMLTRCFSEVYKSQHLTYNETRVCEGWVRFSVFREWMQSQDWEGKNLDKDILIKGNKLYSPETCVFVSQNVNKFLTESDAIRGEFPIGVHWDSDRSKFRSQVNNPFTKKKEYLGLYATATEAHQAWLKRKLEIAYLLAENEPNLAVATAIINRYKEY